MKSKGKLFLTLVCVMTVVTLVLSACGAPAAAPTAAPAAPAQPTAVPATKAPEPTAVPPTEPPAVQATAAPTAAPAAPQGKMPAVVQMPKEIAGGKLVEITVVLKPPESQPESLAAWEAQVKRFQAMYPNVTIKGTDYAYAPDSFAALVAGKQVPTLFEVYLTDPSKMIEQGIATDLTSIFKAQKLDEVFNPNILGITTKDGKIYGIPRFAYAMGLAYNIDMLKKAGFDKPPATWEEAATMAQKLTNRDAGVAGLSFITDGGNATGWQMTTIAYPFGLKQTDIVAPQSGGKYKAGFDNAAMVQALNFVKDLRWKQDVLPRENLDWPKNGEALATDRAAMVVMAGDQLTWIRQTFADADMNKYGFAPLPAGPDGKSVSLVGGNIAMVSSAATPEQAEAAVYWRLFTQFDPAEIMANYEAGKLDKTVVVGAPTLPLYVGAYQDAVTALQKEYANLPVDNYSLFLDGVTSGKVGLQPEPLVAGQEYYGAIGALVSSILTDKGVDVAAAVKTALNTYQSNVLDQLKP